MTNAKVVFLHGLRPEVVDVITSYSTEEFPTTIVNGREASEEQIVEAVKDADCLIVYAARLPDSALRAATKLRLVQLLAAGYDSMNLKLMRELEIPCANNGGANSWAVADQALVLILSLYKQMVFADIAVRSGNWRGPIDGMNTFEMADKLVGILGIGNIGRQVARRVQGFDCKVQYYDKYPLSEEREKELGITAVSLDELFRTSDILTCHTPLTSETRHIVNRERLAMMKPTAVVINTSRGPVVDEEALIEALLEGKIAGAGLDVFEKEPVDPDNPLLKMENVVVSPHSAGTTWDTWYRRADFAYQNIARVWAGEAPQSIAKDYDIE